MKTKFENGLQGNEGGLKKSGKLAVLYFMGTIMFMSLTVVLLLLGHDTARFLVPVGLGMTTAGLMIRADGMKGEKEDEKRN